MERTEAWSDGYRGYREGEAQQENPHIARSPEWCDWENGWRDAQADHEDSKARERWPDD